VHGAGAILLLTQSGKQTCRIYKRRLYALREQIVDQTLEEQRTLLQVLLSAACYTHPIEFISLIEPHVFFVILTGTFV
jgi:hypothetical protein